MFKLIRETRAVQLLKGVLVLFIIYFLSSLFGLVMMSSLLRMFFEAAVILIAIIFQPEIRKALEQMGRNNTYKKYLKFFTKHGKSDEWKKAVRKSIIDAADTAVLFSRSRTGALLVFERETMLSDIAATGTIVDAETSVALFGNIFFNKAPLHDGASIIRDGKLFADLLDTYTILEISAVKTLCRKNDRSALLRKPESHLTAMQEDIDTQSDSGSEVDFSNHDFSFLREIAECPDNSILKSIYKSFSPQLKNS